MKTAFLKKNISPIIPLPQGTNETTQNSLTQTEIGFLFALSGLVGALSWMSGALLSISLGWSLSWFMGGALGWSLGAEFGASLGLSVSLALGGAIGGAAQCLVMRRLFPRISLEDLMIQVLGWAAIGLLGGTMGWALGLLIGWGIGWMLGGPIGAGLGLGLGWTLGWSVGETFRRLSGWAWAWMLGGTLHLMILQRALPLLSPARAVSVIAGWTLAGTCGWAIGKNLHEWLGWTLSWTLGGLICGLIGGGVMIYSLLPYYQTRVMK